jgi:hypothetical protein
MSQVSEAIARFHKLIESDPYIDLSWAEALQERLRAERLLGRPLSPVLRPHFLTSREYASLAKATATVFSAIHRAEQMVLSSPVLLGRMQLLPAERMLAAVEPGYSPEIMAGLLDTNLHNGSLHFIGHRQGAPVSVIYGDLLAGIYYDAPPVKEFRKKHKLTKLSGSKAMIQAILRAYKEFGGKQKKPFIAIVEARAPFQPAGSSENALLAEYLKREGFMAEVVSPEQLEYRNGRLRRGEIEIDIVYRSVSVQEFLVRFDLNHPLVKAYKDGAVCMVNSFRSEVAAKRGIFDLLTDDAITSRFPAAERKAIREFVPWTRLVQAAKTSYHDKTVDLPEFVMKHRERLVLKPNDHASDQSTFLGAEMDDIAWEKALRQAMRSPYVVQEVADPARAVFPLFQYGSLVMKEMQIEVHPHFFAGKLQGASSWLTVAGTAGFSTLSGLAPTFLLEAK